MHWETTARARWGCAAARAGVPINALSWAQLRSVGWAADGFCEFPRGPVNSTRNRYRRAARSVPCRDDDARDGTVSGHASCTTVDRQSRDDGGTGPARGPASARGPARAIWRRRTSRTAVRTGWDWATGMRGSCDDHAFSGDRAPAGAHDGPAFGRRMRVQARPVNARPIATPPRWASYSAPRDWRQRCSTPSSCTGIGARPSCR